MDTRTTPELQCVRRVEGQDYTPTSDRLAPIARQHGHPQRAVRCPRCQWLPQASSRWMCSCTHAWHAFDTGGVCPACKRSWNETQCLQCTAWSPHAHWYDPSLPPQPP